MRIVDPLFKLSEELLETILHFTKETDLVSEETLYKAIDKTISYVKRAVDFLLQIEVISKANSKISINQKQLSSISKSDLIPISIIKKGITDFLPFKEFVKLLQNGKSEKTAAKFVKTIFDIENENETLIRIFNKHIQYLETDLPVIPIIKNKVSNIPKENNFFWIDENGHLIYDDKAHTEQIVGLLEKRKFKNPAFIDQNRIDELKKIQNIDFDTSKLVRLCEEINDAYRTGNYYTVGVLIRVILDHIPPIFGKKNFSEVANNQGSKSFKDVMMNLEIFTRKIADGILHTHIRRKENLPNATTIECKGGLDLLIGEIANELK